MLHGLGRDYHGRRVVLAGFGEEKGWCSNIGGSLGCGNAQGGCVLVVSSYGVGCRAGDGAVVSCLGGG